MKHFVIGSSRTGKTTYAKTLAEKHGFQHISAGRWAREWYLGDYENSQEMTNDPQIIADMTAYSLAVLKAAPNTTIEFMADHYDLYKPSVIEGVRNPRDFMRLYDPAKDVVHRLIYKGNPITPTKFEEGVEIIGRYMEWLQDLALITSEQYIVHEFESIKPETCQKVSLEEIIDGVRWG